VGKASIKPRLPTGDGKEKRCEGLQKGVSSYITGPGNALLIIKKKKGNIGPLAQGKEGGEKSFFSNSGQGGGISF